jgi:glycosyltransferase involved in cell wall biosynthesis
MLRDGVDHQSLSPSRRRIARWALRRAWLILANSEWTRGAAAEMAPSVAAATVFTHSGVDAADRPRDRSAGGPLRVLFLGRLVEWKGPQLLLDAVAWLEKNSPDLRLEVTIGGSAIFGTDGFEAGLRKQAAGLRTPVRFAGHVDPLTYLRQSDVLAHCSLRPEPFGQVLVQAMAARIPVVVPDSGGPMEILGGAVPEVVYRMGDPAALGRALEALGRDRDLRDHAACAGASRVSRFRDQDVTRRIDEHLEALASALTREQLVVDGKAEDST